MTKLKSVPKIALCFSGQPRSWSAGACYYRRNLIEDYRAEVDVYIHTWWDKKTNFNDILSRYQPKRMRVDMPLGEEHAERFTDIASPKHPAIATYSSFYSIAESFKLVPKDTHYDWVIRTRFDYALNGEIDFTKADDKLYVPNCRMTPERNFCNDQFAYGSYKTMAKYCETFDNLDFYYDKRDTRMNGEDMLAANLAFNGLTGPNMVYVDMKNPFPPGPNNSTWHSLIRDDINEWQK